MALGALIGAYQEDDSGGLRALLPLAGRTLLEYQVRCVAAAGAAPVVVVVERVPAALQDAFERLRLDGIGVFPVSDVHEAVTRFEAGSSILLLGDGIAPPAELVGRLAEDGEPVVATLPDDAAHQAFERIDGESRWAGVAVIESRVLGSTAAMLGDWDLQSTLLRRTLQEGALRLPIATGAGEPLLVEQAEQLDHFQQSLVAASRGTRSDWASRFVLPPIEELATLQLLETNVRPVWLMWAALGLTLGGATAFAYGWLATGLALLVLSTPLDIIARRLAAIRLRPLPARMWTRRLLWPAAGLALLALAWWDWRFGAGWGSLVSALTAIAFAEAMRLERGGLGVPGEIWLLSRRNAILAAVPFGIFGAWTGLLVALLLYASASFFYVQHARHLGPELTRS
ncbi:NTP transferase domain-containing protein [Sphingomonas lutea]|uniref:NTP transferase domain-containing protein n=1 Tax=Sphingomonas lutea TaxID=1045317 RepID=A0A7G9SFY1_9SPHN|nr:NTP transferase domain-containing protein [Sphingomonas lutea]QNN66756.1 NTP transferase domain-containing protein [Sphingomonas lutea]